MEASAPNRSPPHSAEAEEHVIACCLLDGSDTIIRAVSQGVREETFYFPANKVLWTNLLELYTKNASVSLETLSAELMTKRLLEAVGGFPYLMQVTGKIPTTAHAGYFIEKVREKELLRESIRIGTSIVEKSYSYAGGGMGEHLSPWVNELSRIQSGATIKDEHSLQDAAQETIKLVEAMIRGEKTTEETVSWGFSDFDRLFYPMMPGELIIIAARPSIGKTTLSDQIALVNALRDTKHVAIFSLEVTVDQKPRKFAQIMSGHSWRRLPKAHEKDRLEFLQALATIKDNQFLHCFYREQSIDGICARIKILKEQKGLKLAILDYLQLIELGQKDSNRNDAIGYATRKLKLLALELNIPIVLLSQLNRANEREGREPRLSDLRDSGNVEQDADRVLFIHRPSVDPLTNTPQDMTDESKDRFYTDIIQAKGRDVGTFRIGMYFNRSRTTFLPIQAHEIPH
jgi:replicative DNA helicase